MKKILLFAGMVALFVPAVAQQFIEGMQSPVKFTDVVKQYELQHPAEPTDKDAAQPPVKPRSLDEAGDKAYQFDRWKWYWQQHLDANGYLVSPMKTWQEWEKMDGTRKAAKTTTVNMSAWTFQGPDSSGAEGSGVGRITTVAFHPTDPNTYWIGSPGGGAWKTTNNGASWRCMTDALPLLSVSDVKINQSNPNTVYLCTGDKDADDYFSIGVMKSYNGGATWTNIGPSWLITDLRLANSLLINPRDTNTVLLGSSQGIYISHNGGSTWTLTPSSGGHNFKQLLYHPTDTNIVYATSRYDNTSGASGQIFRSADGGTTWTQITSFSDAMRITLAVTAANPSMVKALVSSSAGINLDGLEGIYNSTNTGISYTNIYAGGCSGAPNMLSFMADGSACGGQGEYDLSLAISPTDVNHVYVGGVNGWQSTDGGFSWAIMNQWSFDLAGVITIHADKHFMGFHPLLPGRFFECNDGGIYWSDDPTSFGVWNDITNGLGITEVYRVAVSNLATYEMLGAQDNGCKLVQAGAYQDISGGDGMECQMDPLDSNTVYTSSQNGNIMAFIDGLPPSVISPASGGYWITPFIIQPSCNLCLLAGYQDVYFSSDQGASWETISTGLTSGTLNRVAASLSDVNTIYASETGSNNIFYTNDFGATWTTITAPYVGAVNSDIKVDQSDATKIWVTFGGYGSPQVASYSPAAGWTSYNTGLPDVPVNCIMIDTQNQVKYVGTDIGVFYREPTMTSWSAYPAGMPVVRVNDLQINYATNEIWAATYGRSLWKSPRQVDASLETSTLPLAADYLKVAPNPSHGAFTITLKNKVNDKDLMVRLINSAGATVWKQQAGVTNGNTLQANTSGIAAGNYLLEVDDASGVAGRTKVVVY